MDKLLKSLEENGYKVSTDTRKDLSGTVYFGIKGENFDGNTFAKEALEKGAILVVTEDKSTLGEKIFHVDNSLKTLQDIATIYRSKFSIPIIAIGGSNGKTTSKDLVREVLKTKYDTLATSGSFNNHLGVPLSILSLTNDTEIAAFEIGANHPGEHLDLLEIIKPTHVVVTNNGMDHLEGFKSPAGVRKANKEIFDWAAKNNVTAFVNKNHNDLVEDSKKIKNVIFYPTASLKLHSAGKIKTKAKSDEFVAILKGSRIYKTKLTGNYNIENIELALAIGENFGITHDKALKAICKYEPTSKRSQILKKDGNKYILDCYNANPSSMMLSLQSFLKSTKSPQGLILGDMLELGKYSKSEHKKIADFVLKQKTDFKIFIGPEFKKVLPKKSDNFVWFENSKFACEWFAERHFRKYTILLKGSRGTAVEKVINL